MSGEIICTRLSSYMMKHSVIFIGFIYIYIIYVYIHKLYTLKTQYVYNMIDMIENIMLYSICNMRHVIYSMQKYL